MADDRMRLIAELVNRVSDPLKRMQRDVESFAKSGKDLQGVFKKFGTSLVDLDKQERRHGKETTPQLRKEMEALKETLRKTIPQFNELSGQVSAFGAGAGTAIGTVAALGAVIYEATKNAAEFAEQMRNLKFGARETGLSVAQLKQLQLVAEELGMTSDDVTKSVYGFANSMTRLAQHDAGFLQSIQFARRFTGELERLAAAGASTGEELEAMQRAMAEIKKQIPGAKGEQIAQTFAQMFQMDPRMARMTPERMEELTKAMKEAGFDPFGLVEANRKAVEFNGELFKVKVTIDSWKTALENALLGPLTEALHLLNLIIEGKLGLQGKMLEEWNRPPAPVVPPGFTFTPESSKPGGRKGVLGSKGPGGGWKPFAEGGIVTKPTAAIIGEQGPEAVVPLTGSGFDPFVQMQLLIEKLFGEGAGNDAARSAGKLVGMSGINLQRNNLHTGEIPRMLRERGGGRRELGRHIGMEKERGGARRGLARHLGMDRPIDMPLSGTLAQQRAGYIKELNENPRLKNFAIDAMQHEGGIQSNMEQLFNYAAMRHMTINQALHSGQYGPVNTGQITGNISSRIKEAGEIALSRVGAGSNITDYATDQGMAGDPNFAKYMANRSYYNMHQVEGAWFSYHGDQGRKWAQQQRERDAMAANAAADRQALSNAQTQQVEGTGRLDVNVSAPPGTKVDAKGGGIFQKTNVQRNVQMFGAQAGPVQQYTGYDVPWWH